MKRVVAIVPAAGRSQRFGVANKLLQPFGQSTVVGTVVATLQVAGLPVLVVTGHERELIEAACPGAEFVFNPRYEEGLGSSIGAGVTAVGDVDGVMIALADMPRINPAVIRAVENRFEALPLTPQTAIVSVRYADEPDRPGHPILYGSAYLPELKQLSGDVGARALLMANRDRWVLIDWPGRLADFDTPADFG